jgi:UDP-N-acetyl-D-glucosamine dehydrogenase
LLEQRGAHVQYHDPFVPSVRLEGEGHMESTPYSAELLAGADCVVIVTDHSSYDWQHVLDHSKLVVDTRNATAGRRGAARIESL